MPYEEWVESVTLIYSKVSEWLIMSLGMKMMMLFSLVAIMMMMMIFNIGVSYKYDYHCVAAVDFPLGTMHYDVATQAKTNDNLIITLRTDIEYRLLKAHYKVGTPEKHMLHYVENALRAHVSEMDLNSVLDNTNEFVIAILKEMEKEVGGRFRALSEIRGACPRWKEEIDWKSGSGKYMPLLSEAISLFDQREDYSTLKLFISF